MVNLTAENGQCGAQKGRLESPAERLFYGYGSTFVPIRSSWKCLYDNSRIFLETKFRVRMKAIRATALVHSVMLQVAMLALQVAFAASQPSVPKGLKSFGVAVKEATLVKGVVSAIRPRTPQPKPLTTDTRLQTLHSCTLSIEPPHQVALSSTRGTLRLGAEVALSCGDTHRISAADPPPLSRPPFSS